MHLEEEFLRESNAIEREYSKTAFEDAKLAWDYAKAHRHDINLNYVLGIHRRLMRTLDPEIAGIIRNVPMIVVGGRYKCLPSTKVHGLLRFWVKQGYRDEGDIDRLHTYFLIIHPFEDGNGRTSRILMNAQRLNVGLPIIIIKESERMAYYRKYFP